MSNIDTYGEAVCALRKVPIVSPCYVVVAGAQKGEGIVRTRDVDADVNPAYLTGGIKGADDVRFGVCDATITFAPVLIQANMDYWLVSDRRCRDVEESRGRVKKAVSLLVDLDQREDAVRAAVLAMYTAGSAGKPDVPKDNKGAPLTCVAPTDRRAHEPLHVSMPALLSILKTPPIFAEDTIYTTVCCPAAGVFVNETMSGTASSGKGRTSASLRLPTKTSRR